MFIKIRALGSEFLAESFSFVCCACAPHHPYPKPPLVTTREVTKYFAQCVSKGVSVPQELQEKLKGFTVPTGVA